MYSEQQPKRASRLGLRSMTSRFFNKGPPQPSHPDQHQYDPYQPNPYLQNPYHPQPQQPRQQLQPQQQQQWTSHRPLPYRGTPSRLPPQMPNPHHAQANPARAPAPAASRSRRLQALSLSSTNRQTSKTPKITTIPLSATKIRSLRDLIRHRYALDVEIWSIGQRVKWYQRDSVIAKMAQADAALVAIKWRLDVWDRPEYFQDKEGRPDREAWMRFREIKKRVMEAKVRNWKLEPPWKREEGEIEGVRSGVYEADGSNSIYVARPTRTRGGS